MFKKYFILSVLFSASIANAGKTLENFWRYGHIGAITAAATGAGTYTLTRNADISSTVGAACGMGAMQSMTGRNNLEEVAKEAFKPVVVHACTEFLVPAVIAALRVMRTPEFLISEQKVSPAAANLVVFAYVTAAKKLGMLLEV